MPALAVADALRANGAEVQFVGGDRAEAELVPAAGYEFHQLKVAALPRRSAVGAARAVAIDAVALASATQLIHRLRPDAVYGGGGYVAGPIGITAAMLRVPLVIAEIDGHLGLTNRMLAPLARRVCTALPIGSGNNSKFVITGRPIPPIPADRDAARARFDVGPDETLVLVFGGSLGARSINHAAVDAFADSDFRVLHASGARDLPDLSSPRPGYDLRGYISEFMEAVVACDLAVARSGGSIWELAAAGAPSILVPYPHATGDHQTPERALPGRRRGCRDHRRCGPRRRAVEDRGRHVAVRPNAAECDGARSAGTRSTSRCGGDRIRDSRRCWTGDRRPGVSTPASSRRATTRSPAMSEVDTQPPSTASGLWAGRKLHFVGIGGAGMSGLALIAAKLGAAITGSDRGESSYLVPLRAAGIEPVFGHAAENVPPGAQVVYSSAIDSENPERRAAVSGGGELHRSELLAEIAALKRCLAVSGAAAQDDNHRDGRAHPERRWPGPGLRRRR